MKCLQTMKCLQNKSHTLKKPVWNEYQQEFIKSVPIICGKCAGCLHRKIAEWTFRLSNERENAVCTYFVTLTYDPRYVPLNEHGKMTLNKKDLQQFFKNLRHAQKRKEDYGSLENHYFKTDLKKQKIKYYAVGEYGRKRSRPHYHIIIYNASKDYIEKCWKMGSVDVQIPRSTSAIGYTIKYLSKRVFSKPIKNVTPEFSLMSKGIGHGYIDKMKKWHKKNLDILYTFDQHHSGIPMSKYYRNHIYSESEKIKQIPIIKVNMEIEYNKEIIRWGGEDKARERELYKQFSFQSKFMKNAIRRADL